MRIRRADLPEQNSQAVYQRMQTERQREAAEFRAQGGQETGDRSNADREATVIVAEANSTAEQVRAPATANATGCRRGLWQGCRFLRILPLDGGGENGLKSNDTRFRCGRPDFFKFFSNSSGKLPVAAALPAAVVAAPKP